VQSMKRVVINKKFSPDLVPGFVRTGEPNRAISGHFLKMLMHIKYEVRLTTWVGALFCLPCYVEGK